MKNLVFLKKTHDELLEYSTKIIFNKKHSLHFSIIALYSSLIELAGCIVILVDNNGKIGVPVVFRTLLEAYVDLYNLIEDPNYGYYMEASHNKRWLKVLEEAEQASNPYLTSITEYSDLKGSINKCKQELGELKKRGTLHSLYFPNLSVQI